MISNESDSEEAYISWRDLKTNNSIDDIDNDKALIPRLSSLSTDEVDGSGSSKLASNLLNSFNQTTPYSLLVQSLIKQLCRFIEIDNQRSTALYNKICEKLYEMKFIDESYEKSEFENIRTSYELALKNLVEATRTDALAATGQQLEVWPLMNSPRAALEWSRYYKDFEEIDKIGEGGFGDVWKSKHKLDGEFYAIKKIKVKATSVKNILNHLREVKTLASLSHENIVPYKSAWLEPWTTFHEETMVETATTFQTDTSDGSSYSEITSKIQKDSLRLKSDSFQIDFEYSQEQKSTLKSKDESISKVEKLRKLTHIEQNGAIIPHVKLAWAILYIQMKLCQKTLRNFLDERNVSSSFEDYYSRFFYSHHKMSNEKIVLKMFLQMCSGLSYIHNKGIVHHDIKPSNVFITNEDNNSNLSLQLGDFGLACPLESTQNNNEVDVKHNGFGTRLYAAPEQLSGICNKKSDIYSMGVILIELLKKCLTVMECYKNIQTIKKGEVVPEIGDDLCKGLIKNLLDPVENRPSIENLSDIIRERINLSNNEVEHLKRVISQRDDEIQQKDQTIEQLRNEILSLKKQLSTDDIKKCEIVLDQ